MDYTQEQREKAKDESPKAQRLWEAGSGKREAGSGGAEIEVFVTSKAINTSTAALETERAMTEVLAGEGKSLTNVPLLLYV